MPKPEIDRRQRDGAGNAKTQSCLSIVVTGGAGFIGSHLCDRLVRRGHYVICIDNLYTGSLDNIRPLKQHPRFRFLQHDVRDPLDLPEPVHQIYNLACAASPRHYQRDPVGTLQTCVIGAFNVLNLARRKSARVLQASTSEVYGDPQTHPQAEDYLGHVNPVGPRACYDEGKRAAETLFFDFRRSHGVPIKISRIFNTYGPRMMENDGRVVSNFVVQALRNEPLTIYGNGEQTRSFCYIDDLTFGLELMMASEDHVTGPCNLGNPHEVTIGQIADLVVELTGSTSPITYKPLPQDDPKRRRPAIERAMRLLGWQPRVSLENGLKATIRYFSLKLFGQESPSLAPISYHPMPAERKRPKPATNAHNGLAAVAPSQD
jgi:UDP-glucuronate decarboxylase